MRVFEILKEAKKPKMWEVPYKDRDKRKWKNISRDDYDRLSAGAERRYTSEFDYFKDQVESIVGASMDSKETRDAYFEWEQGSTTAEDFAAWIQRDRDDMEFDKMYPASDNEPEYEIDPNDDFVDPRDEDQTDYSMRQGEMGNPDRQR